MAAFLSFDIVFAVSGLPEHCTIFHFPYVCSFVTGVTSQLFFSVFWWFRPWKPYIFIMHIILADRPGPPESPEPPVHLDHLEHPNSTNMTTNIETVALFSTAQ